MRVYDVAQIEAARDRAIRTFTWKPDLSVPPELLAKDVLILHGLLVDARKQLAMRLEQLDFGPACASHGLEYSETCGGCSCAFIVAAYGSSFAALPVAAPAEKKAER